MGTRNKERIYNVRNAYCILIHSHSLSIARVECCRKMRQRNHWNGSCKQRVFFLFIFFLNVQAQWNLCALYIFLTCVPSKWSRKINSKWINRLDNGEEDIGSTTKKKIHQWNIHIHSTISKLFRAKLVLNLIYQRSFLYSSFSLAFSQLMPKLVVVLLWPPLFLFQCFKHYELFEANVNAQQR